MFHTRLNLKIGNFNVMSQLTTKFSKPAGTYIHTPESEETDNEWKKRFDLTIQFLSRLNFDILAIQEATKQFYDMIYPHFINSYFLSYNPQDNLLTLIKQSICFSVEEIPVIQHKFSKLAAYNIHLINGIIIKLVNVHLTGDPSKTLERIKILKENIDVNSIIIGDYNESVISLLDNHEFRDYLIQNNYRLDNHDDNMMTAYSRYIIRGGYVLGIKPIDKQWECIDNVMYGGNIVLIKSNIFPENGLNGRSVPYLPLTDIPPYKYTRNYVGEGWSSDHSCNLYEFLI